MIIITVLFSFRVIHLYYFISNSWFSLLFTLLLVVVFTNDKSVFSRISRNTILVRTGIISYGMYLYHPLISGILHLLIKGQTPRIQGASDLCLTILSFIITVIVSHFSYKYFEKRGILFGHKFEY
jgi:peptidoglycan/LPS O-acetylase OafA/YrhL